MTHNKIIDHFNELKVNQELAFSNIPRNENQYLTHAYHRYPAKFIPTLAAHLIKKNSDEGDLICDPFGGCGTSLVEAKVNGRYSIGIDINPLAALISRTKITPIDPKRLNDAIAFLLTEIKLQKNPSFRVNSEKLRFWFDEETINKLSLIYSVIQTTDDRDLRRFYQCAFSHILKNCSKWLMKSIKPTVNRYKIPADPFYIFPKHLKFMARKNLDFYNKVRNENYAQIKSTFYIRDARRTNLLPNSIDYILTSPPYVTSYEYADLHQLSILWFEYTDDWLKFKKKFIGTSHRIAKNKNIYSAIGEEIIKKLMYNDAALARGVKTYYEDMADFILESKRILKSGKKASLVIGNTMISGVDILNAEVCFEQMQNLGFRALKVEKRQTSSQSITPFRDTRTGRFTSKNNPNKRRAYQYEYILCGTN